MGDLLSASAIATGNASGASAAAAMFPIPLVASEIAQTLAIRLAVDRNRLAKFLMARTFAVVLTRSPHYICHRHYCLSATPVVTAR
jgi:hypothetical protein